jgi:outer membrane cobalamin receptor
MFAGTAVMQRFSVLGETAEETFEQRFVFLPGADQSQSLRESGVAAEYWLGYDERIFVSLGARQDWNDRFADAATWRTTISALLPANMRLHGSAGTGVKTPDFFELFGSSRSAWSRARVST